MTNFKLSEKEELAAAEFRQYIRDEYGNKHFRTARFVYTFEPNAIGVNVTITDVGSGESRDITDVEAW